MMELSALPDLLNSEHFRPIDRHFADLMKRLAHGKPSKDEALSAITLAAAMVSRRLADGEVCLALPSVANQSYPSAPVDGIKSVHCPPLQNWRKVLLESPVVGCPGEFKPMILDASNRLYLHRFWNYEQSVAQDLRRRLNEAPIALDNPRLTDGLKRLFPTRHAKVFDWQRMAAFSAIRQRFCIVTGGPGTGKTWTVARMLVLLLEQPGCEGFRVKLIAPTGKAVMRLRESLRDSVGDLECSDSIKDKLQDPKLTATIHSLLGAVPNSQKFRHDEDNPVPVDVLVVDEASMISLSLMARLLSALTPHVRLILVGDKDQLPPVDPGGVLEQICKASAINRFSEDFSVASQVCGGPENIAHENADSGGKLLNAVVQLKTNHRTRETSHLHKVGVAVNEGRGNDALQLMPSSLPEIESDVSRQDLPEPKLLKDGLRSLVLEHYGCVLKADSPDEAFKALDRFRILCAVREGPYGCVKINGLVEEILREANLIAEKDLGSENYSGQAVMVTANNYTVKLFNGDIGVVWRKQEAGSSVVHFPVGDGSMRAIARERLPEYENAHAMTVHKSQGSEFEHVLLIIPDLEVPVLTRSLIYTGLTRAKVSLLVMANKSILRWAIDRQVIAQSGLSEALTA